MKAVKPTVFPKPGTYSTDRIHINIMSLTNDAQIHYTLDGSDPTGESSVFQIEDGLLTLKPDAHSGKNSEENQQTDFIIKAIARKAGYQDSDIAEFHFSLKSLPKGEYFYTMLQVKAEGKPAVVRIEDEFQVKMYFVIGSERALLIDGGLNKENDLKNLLDTMADGLPYDAVITHAHPDHVAQAQALIDQGITVYYNPEDLPTFEKFGGSLSGFIDIKAGYIFDLGDCQLKVYEIPGHTVGQLVLLDEKNGLLFSSDAFGNNRNTFLDTALLHLGGGKVSTMDRYLSVLQNFCYETKGKINKIFTGHNDNVLSESYLKNLEMAIQQAVDLGEKALTPTLRPAAECLGSNKISLIGDYISDLDWIGVNVIELFSENYTAENIATLSAIFIKNGILSSKFQPNIETYTLMVDPGIHEIEICAISTSGRAKGIWMNHTEVKRKEWRKIKVHNQMEIEIRVIAPNGVNEKIYKLLVEVADV